MFSRSGYFYFISLQDYCIDLLIANGQIGFCCFVLISSVYQIFYWFILFCLWSLVHFGVDSYCKSCELVIIAKEQIWVFYVTICNTATLFYWFFLFCCLVLHFVVDWYDKSCELVYQRSQSTGYLKKKLLCLIKGHWKKLLYG